MKTKTVTIKGWANNSDLMFSPNTKNNVFIENLNKYIETNLKGFKKLSCFDTLKGKGAKEKVVIRGRYWRGSWSAPTNEIHSVFYR